jgi:hypothetical protein
LVFRSVFICNPGRQNDYPGLPIKMTHGTWPTPWQFSVKTAVIRNYKPMPHPTPWNAYGWPRPSSALYANRWKYCVIDKTSNISLWGTVFQFTREFWDISAAVVVVSLCVQLQTQNLQIIHSCLHPNLFLSNCMPQYTHTHLICNIRGFIPLI